MANDKRTPTTLIYLVLAICAIQALVCQKAFFFWFDHFHNAPLLATYWITLTLAGFGLASAMPVALKKFLSR